MTPGFNRSSRRASAVVLAVILALQMATPAQAQPIKRLRKVDPQIKMQRDACRLGLCKKHARRSGRSQDHHDERFNVIICFDQPLTDAQVDAYEASGVHFMRRPSGNLSHYGTYYAAWVSLDALEWLDDDPTVTKIEPGMPANAISTLDRSVPEIQADVRHTMPVGSDIWGNQGEGVVVADFELVSIDVTHPDFFKAQEFIFYDWIDADGNGLFAGGTDYVDLNRNGLADTNERLGVHDVYITDGVYNADIDWLYNDVNGNNTRDTGTAAGFSETSPTYGERLFYTVDQNNNRRLDLGEQLVALGQSKIKGVLRRDGSEYLRGDNLIAAPVPDVGHGTSVCSILLGQDRGYNRKHVGVAPDAELLFVEFGGDEANMLDQVLWAKERGATVFLWEFGSWTGRFLDGSSFLEEFIAQEMLTNSSIQVTPNGNLASSGRHAQGAVAANGQTIEPFNLPAVGATSLTISVLWQGNDQDFSFGIRRLGSPSFAPVNEITDISDFLTFEGDHWAVRGGITSNRGTARFDVTLYRDSGAIQTGDWQLQVINHTGSAKSLDFMIQDNATFWSGGVQWTSDVTDAATLCYPATNDYSLNVASYGIDSAVGQLSYFSSRGPTITGQPLRGIAAPGHHDIFCAQSSGAPGEGWAAWRTNFGGTSAAGPHAAGAAALLLSAIPQATPQQVYDAILLSGRSDANTGATPNNDWGWGKLRVDDAYHALADEVCPQISNVVIQAPGDGAVDLDYQSVELRWQPAANAQAYDVHFGTSNPPEVFLPNVNLTSFPMTNLEENTTYYWQVFAKNFCGYTAAGPVRSFVTGGGAEPEIEVVYEGQSLLNTQMVTVPDTSVGQETTMTFLVENNGPAPLEIAQSIELVNNFQGAYSVTADLPAVIEAFGAAEFEISFAPDAGGTYFTTARIYSNDTDEGTFQIMLSATVQVFPRMAVSYLAPDGQPRAVEQDVPVNFEGALLSQDSQVIFLIENLGDADLDLGAVELSGPNADAFDVTLLLSATTLAPGDAPAELTVTFTPGATGLHEAALSIDSNDPENAPFAALLTGSGIEEVIEPPPVNNDPIIDPPIEGDPIEEDCLPELVSYDAQTGRVEFYDPCTDETTVGYGTPLECAADPNRCQDNPPPKNKEQDPKQVDGPINGNGDEPGRGFGEGRGQGGGGGGSSPCGAGGMGLLPILFFGLCGLRLGSTRQSSRSFLR